MTETLMALYSTVMTMYDLFSAISGWFGSRAVVALIGIFFFYRLFRNLFPKAALFSFFASLGVFTTLWATWNFHYSENWELPMIGQTYAFLAAHALIFYLLQWVIRRMERAFRAWRKKRSGERRDPLELYEEVDASANRIKSAIKEDNLKEALRHIEELAENFRSHGKANS